MLTHQTIISPWISKSNSRIQRHNIKLYIYRRLMATPSNSRGRIFSQSSHHDIKNTSFSFPYTIRNRAVTKRSKAVDPQKSQYSFFIRYGDRRIRITSKSDLSIFYNRQIGCKIAERNYATTVLFYFRGSSGDNIEELVYVYVHLCDDGIGKALVF